MPRESDKMTRSAKKTGSALKQSKQPKTCAAGFWKLFPHLTLCGTLVIYAMLGAVVFQLIEGRSTWRTRQIEEEYRSFLTELVEQVKNDTGNGSNTTEVVKNVTRKMKGFKSIWSQSPDRWSFSESLLFSCTVFTTVGYGEIFPVTLIGKVVCVIYAMVGIPLMLLLMLDVGDFLALVMSRTYSKFHKLFTAFRSRNWLPWKARGRELHSDLQTLEDGTFAFGHDVVIRKPLDIRHVLHSQADVRHKSIRLQNNKNIFEKIIAKENLVRKSPLLRSLSCPQLDHLPLSSTGYVIWDFSGLGDGMDMLNVPLVLVIFVVIAYICLGGSILSLWEKDFSGFDSYYFCFITLTTIGFGDIVPNNHKFFILTSLFILIGMTIMSMAFKLSQTRIVSCYRKCIKFVSGGNVRNEEDD
ncbi:potassium channel subfamily K member 18 [Kryptolebias marmoratus]|uniref:Potassium two pore domain channel subfamily K member 18 n=1 Tax=Kryptolebias marmoratus TaxID=37003 RepID=A0A3Q3AZT9_KRYMA|nr:potassium channel subfamily K member 18 [Kryptolebias marmoratus]